MVPACSLATCAAVAATQPPCSQTAHTARPTTPCLASSLRAFPGHAGITPAKLPANSALPRHHRVRPAPWRASSSRVVCAVAAPSFGKQMLVMVPPHPLVKHWIAILRNAASPPPMFRCALGELGRILAYEATRDWLPMIQGEVHTPCGIAEVEAVDPSQPIAIVPILRAGTVMTEQLGPVIPHTITYHLGYCRNEETLQPTCYLNKLPASISPSTKVIIFDAMLATGGTIMAAMDDVVSRGATSDNIRVVSAIVASPALKQLSEKYKGLRVYTGMIDADVNEKGFIVPGLGDAGDRSFGTL